MPHPSDYSHRMSHPSASSAGFRPSELARRRFQEAAAITLNNQAQAIVATREFIADLAVRIDGLQKELIALEADHAKMKAKKSFLERLQWILSGR